MSGKKWMLVMLCILAGFSQVFSQMYGQYARGKIVLKNGNIVEGKKMIIDEKTISIQLGYGNVQTYDLYDVNQAMAKSDHATKGCLIGGGGCLALGVLVYAAGDEQTFKDAYDGKTKSEAAGQYFLGLALWSGCLGGVGYLIGKATENWKIVYISTSSQLKPTLRVPLEKVTRFSPAAILGRYIRE